MATVKRSIRVAAPAEELFALAQDYSLRRRWDPIHGEYEFLDGTDKGPGARLRYRAKSGVTMNVRYVSFQPPERAAIAMISGPYVFERFAGAWIFKRLGASETLVEFQYHFALRPRWLSWALNSVVRASLTRGMDARLRGLKQFAERAQNSLPILLYP